MQLFLVQFGNAHLHETPGGNPFESLLGLVAVVGGGVLLVQTLGMLVPRSRGAVRGWRRRRRRLREAAIAEQRARALMSELCPHGWRAQITLYDGSAADGPADPAERAAPVLLEWTEFEDPSGRAAVSRRIWAADIREALEKMVADRRTDETLEQIERGARIDGAWPEA